MIGGVGPAPAGGNGNAKPVGAIGATGNARPVAGTRTHQSGGQKTLSKSGAMQARKNVKSQVQHRMVDFRKQLSGLDKKLADKARSLKALKGGGPLEKGNFTSLRSFLKVTKAQAIKIGGAVDATKAKASEHIAKIKPGGTASIHGPPGTRLNIKG